jgi:hypothetical protein
LDEVKDSVEQKVIKLGGKEYPLKPITVSDFVEMAKHDGDVDENSPIEEQIDALVKMVCRSFDGIPEDEVRKLTFDKLMAIVNFMQEVAEEGSASVEEGKS